ncbi:MAG: hypothetical protein RRC07_09590 [Anaerolineae bacterium]|nr:hypothetical protein [Anaerolineae bacterium]
MVITGDTTQWLGHLRGAPLPVLLLLYRGGRLGQMQIARATGMKLQTVREALHVLEMHGLAMALRGDRWLITQQGDALVAQLQRRRGR